MKKDTHTQKKQNLKPSTLKDSSDRKSNQNPAGSTGATAALLSSQKGATGRGIYS